MYTCAITFMETYLENVPSPSILTSRPDKISWSPRNHFTVGVGAPLISTLMIKLVPDLIEAILSLSDWSYSIFGAPRKT